MFTKLTRLTLVWFALWIVTAVFVTLLLLTYSQNSPILQNGSPLPELLGDKYYTITASTYDAETKSYYYCFSGALHDEPDILIINALSPFSVFSSSGELVYTSDADSAAKRIHHISLGNCCYDQHSGFLSFEIRTASDSSASEFMQLVCVLLGAHDALELHTTTMEILRGCAFGALILMFCNALILYLEKQSEKYLIYFLAYSFILLLWSFPDALSNTFSTISLLLDRYADMTHAFLSSIIIALCFDIFGVCLRGKLNLLTKWYFLCASMIFLQLLFYCLFGKVSSQPLGSFLRTTIYLYALASLSYSCAKKKPGARYVSAGFAVGLGMRWLFMLCTTNAYVIDGFTAMAIQCRLPDIILAGICMTLVNMAFAKKFKEAERLGNEIAELNRSLDEKVLQRTKELEDLQQQRRNMMVNIFHDLRTPLFITKGYADMIHVEPGDSEVKMRILKDRLNYVTNLAEQLFYVAKLEDHQILFSDEPFDIAKSLKTSVESCDLESKKKNINIFADIPDSCILCGDKMRMQQAFLNLITNAICYTPAGGSVAVGLMEYNGIIHIHVTDTGSGIEQKNIEKIFTRYYSAHNKKSDSSSGLGLAIAKEIIEQHGGKITVQSEIGAGTAFSVVFAKDC